MKSLLQRLLLFATPFLMAGFLLHCIPYNKIFSYRYVLGDCGGRTQWMYHRLFDDKRPVDIVFLGSSRTISAIEERRIESRLYKNTGQQWHLLNFGYCRYGRNLHDLLMKDLLKNKKPKHLFLEVRLDENRFSHPMFPYLADNEEIRSSVWWVNHDIVNDWYKATQSRLEYWRRQLRNDSVSMAPSKRLYGYGYSNVEGDSTILKEVKEQKRHHIKALKEGSQGKHWQNRFARKYIERLVDRCREAGIQVHFIHIPSFATIDQPLLSEYYKSYGSLLIPPKWLISHYQYWADDQHMNNKGAVVFAEWFVKELEKIL